MKRSLREIAKALAVKGMMGPSGKPYLAGSVSAMLKKTPSRSPDIIRDAAIKPPPPEGLEHHDSGAELSRFRSTILQELRTAAPAVLRRFGPSKPPSGAAKATPSPARRLGTIRIRTARSEAPDAHQCKAPPGLVRFAGNNASCHGAS